ncbi:MAG: sigma-70 family RNA polymerase sigma factor [Myxococcales bacterium]
MRPSQRASAFEQAVAPHLPAAYDLCRWLIRDATEAEDALQEACVRAFRFFDGFSGQKPRAWLLAVVRNTCFTRRKARAALKPEAFDDGTVVHLPRHPDPEAALLNSATARSINDAVAALPEDFREVFVLRELEGLSYKEIAEVAQVPIGTVMSRLSRAREALQRALAQPGKEKTP